MYAQRRHLLHESSSSCTALPSAPSY
jgi:hypothetical protein